MGSRVYIECVECGANVIQSDDGEVTFLCDCLERKIGKMDPIGPDEDTPLINPENGGGQDAPEEREEQEDNLSQH